MENENKKEIAKFDTKLMFWIGILVIGIGALITGIILLVKDKNNLMWLIIGFGIFLFLLGLLFTVYLIVLKQKRKHIRKDIENKGI